MYDLVEVFESFQGEGRNSGKQCVFVRFAGCNFACPWCDTDFRRRFSLPLDELLSEMERCRSRNAILTGGEPTLVKEMPELVAALKARGWWIAVETNGSASRDQAPWLDFVDYVACSPKLEHEDELRLEEADEVRVVASGDGIVPFCERVVGRIRATDYYVSPCERDGVFDYATAKAALAKLPRWSLSVQLHKILGFR